MKKPTFILMALLMIAGKVSAQNVIACTNVTVNRGQQVELPIELTNNADLTVVGISFTLTLPEGVTVETDEEDEPVISFVSSRLNPKRFSPYSTQNADGSWGIRISTNSQTAALQGTEGAFMTITVNIADDMEAGDYDISLTGNKLSVRGSDNNVTSITIGNSTSTLTVSNPTTDTIVFDEDADNANALAETGLHNVRVKRTINANEWSTICLPFAMTEAQVKEAFGDDVQLADFIGTDPEYDENDNVVAITANFTEAQAIEANYPYIIKVSTAVTEFTVDGVDIVADEDEAYIEFDNGKTGSRRVVYSGFYGTYHAQTVLDEFTLFLSDNKFWYSTGLTKMKAFRAYFEFLDILTEVEEANGIKIWVGDDATGIESIDHSSLTVDHRYNLAGQRVGKDYKGIVIENGKKIIK